MKKILVFGSFDILHKGHIYFLKSAKKLGDELVVVVGLDKTIEKIKGRLPLYNENERLKHVKDLLIANRVVLGYLEDKYKIIEKIKPDIIALGYDQNSFTKGLKKELEKRGLNVKIVRLKSFKPEVYKSSLIRNN